MRTQQRKQLHAPPDDDAPDLTQSTSVAPPSGLRKKGTGTRPWLFLDTSGQAQVVEAGKHAIMRRTGLPARDLRILDPNLSYPSTLLGREKAIVINLEHIKAIITAQEVLLQNSKDPFVMPFVDELQRKILRRYQAVRAQERGSNGDDQDWARLYGLEDPHSGTASPENSTVGFPKRQKDEGYQEDGKQGLDSRDGMKVLPFEFVALEACLEATCTSLDNDARTLEHEAHPALDKLTSKISTLNLERVRQIKSRLVAITGRVQKVRDELEHLLDDDDDMAEMYLTEKMIQQNLDSSSGSPANDREDAGPEETTESDPAEITMEADVEGDIHMMGNQREQLYNKSKAFSRDSHGTHTSSTRSAISKHLDVEELEMLLEAYFVQIDGTLNKLSTLREYVDDTEDYINIMLDDKQNNLLQMGVMLTTATLVVSAFVVVAGIFGMNIKIELFNDEKIKTNDFIWTVAGSTVGSIILYVIAIAWCRHKKLLE